MPSIPPLTAAGLALILSAAGAVAGTCLQPIPLFQAQASPPGELAATIPEISAALLGGIGFLLLLCTRRNR